MWDKHCIVEENQLNLCKKHGYFIKVAGFNLWKEYESEPMNIWIFHSSSLCLYHRDDIRRNMGCQKSWWWRSSIIYTPHWYVSDERFSTLDLTCAFITQMMGWFQQAAAPLLCKKIYGWLNNVCAVNFPKKIKGLIVFYACDRKMGFEYISFA